MGDKDAGAFMAGQIKLGVLQRPPEGTETEWDRDVFEQGFGVNSYYLVKSDFDDAVVKCSRSAADGGYMNAIRDKEVGLPAVHSGSIVEIGINNGMLSYTVDGERRDLTWIRELQAPHGQYPPTRPDSELAIAVVMSQGQVSIIDDET